nr:MAG TPA: hypothetical protein [Caudoviricetes sp.]
MKTVLIPTLTAAKNVDIYNASFISTTDLDNGSVFGKGELTESGSQVYKVTTPATGSLSGLWMACSPEDTIITDAAGNQYKPGINNPQTFTNVANVVFSGFKPQVGDLILMTADGLDGEIGDNTYVVAENGSNKLKPATAAITGLSFKLVETSYISIGGLNAIGSQRVPAYLLECVAN